MEQKQEEEENNKDAHLLSDDDRLHVLRVEAVTEVADPSRDLVERHRLLPTVPLHYEHGCLWVAPEDNNLVVVQ